MCATDFALSRTAAVFLEPVPYFNCANYWLSLGKVTYYWNRIHNRHGANGGADQEEFAPATRHARI
jgi:hypothetical protein